MADLVRGHPDGNRVENFRPFASNGQGNAYPPGYILREPECYRRLAAWMAH